MSEFPFPKLLAFLKNEADQVEFMKVASEVGLSKSDQEIAKLLLALQLYKAYYADIPRQIEAVHAAALDQVERVRDDVKTVGEGVATNAAQFEQWVERIKESISAVQPAAVAEMLHRRLVEDALAAVGCTVQVLAAAYGRIDTATAKLDAAAAQAEASIQEWQTVTLRRVWASAFGVCAAVTTIIGVVAWLIYSGH